MDQCTKNAIEFLKEIKGGLNQNKFDEFVKAFKDYRAQRFDHVVPLFYFFVYSVRGI